MAQHSNEMAEFTIKHRAVCENGDLDAPWHETLEEAANDATAHQGEHPTHKVKLITQQTLAMDFAG